MENLEEIERVQCEQAQERAADEARTKANRMRGDFPAMTSWDVEQWLRDAHIHQEGTIAWLRQRIKILQAYAVANLHQPGPISLREARLLDVCRICLKPRGIPFLLNYGDEYAHTACVDALVEGGKR